MDIKLEDSHACCAKFDTFVGLLRVVVFLLASLGSRPVLGPFYRSLCFCSSVCFL